MRTPPPVGSSCRVGARSAVIALPAFPTARLWRETMERMDVSFDGATQRMEGIDKYGVPVSPFDPEAVPHKALYLLNTASVDQVSLSPLAPADAFAQLPHVMHRRRIARALGQGEAMFRALSSLCATLPIKRVQQPVNGFELGALADAIETDAAGQTQARTEAVL